MSGYQDTAKRNAVLELRRTGLTTMQIAERMGMKNNQWVCKVCKENGLGGTASWKEKRYKEYRDYKAQGHSNLEVAKRFGISEATAARVCKGIASQASKGWGWKSNQYTSGKFDRVANAVNIIAKHAPDFEYAGGFTSVDGPIQVRCKVCGYVQTRSMITIRHHHIECENCRNIEAERKEKAKQDERRKAEADKQEQKRKRQLQARVEQFEFKECEVCGGLFVVAPQSKRKYCSAECMHKANNNRKWHRRRAKLRNACVDKDIEIHKLYERDGGVCHLCGEMCDWNDKQTIEGAVICGDKYPSIDHVTPLARGGEHSWDNVRLAHRGCNTQKGAKYTSPWG